MVEEQLRQGKTLEDARAGGCSGCVEAGAFGKEAYILTGYFNLPKVLELALHDGVDPRTGRRLGPRDRRPGCARDPSTRLFAAFEAQLRHFARRQDRGQPAHRADVRAADAGAVPLGADRRLHRATGRDYNAGGARYNNTYIQGVGIGTITDALAAIRQRGLRGAGG